MAERKDPLEDGLGYQQGHNFYDPNMDRATGGDDNIQDLASGVSERKLMAKIDLRLIPVLTIMYLLAFLDRTNIGNAEIYGMATDLKLTKLKYNTALVMFFVSYCVFEIPSNILLKKFKPSRWLSLCMFLFGVVTLCQGLVKTYSGLLATRFFLGLAETGMFPGCFYIISMYYRRSEAQRRYTFFFSSTSLAGAFGGLIAYGIGHIKHPLLNSSHTGLEGAWRWVFIIEGSFTAFLAIFFWFLLPNFPEDAKWLSNEERAYLKAKLAEDQGKSGIEQHFTTGAVARVFKDWKIFLITLMYFGGIVPAYGYAYFSPSIIKGFGYSAVKTQLMSVPPWAASWAFSNFIAFCSDKTRHRTLFTLFPLVVGIVGFAMSLGVHHHRSVQYGSLFLITSGTYTALAQIVCWGQMNTSGHIRRAVASAFQVGVGNLGGIVAVYVFPTADAPDYYLGYGICLAFLAMSLIASFVYFLALLTQNRNRERTPQTDLTEYEKTQQGDMASSFRYMI